MDRYTGTILKDRYVLEDMIGRAPSPCFATAIS